MAVGSCPFKITNQLVIHCFLTFGLLAVYVAQGIFLDIFIIKINTSNSLLYFTLVPDFILMFGYAGAMAASYQSNRENSKPKCHKRRTKPSSCFFQRYKNILGFYPYTYIVWLIYSLILIIKIIVIFKSEIMNTGSDSYLLNPELLKFLLASTVIIFMLFVEGHHNESPNSNFYDLMTSIYSHVALELLDSIAFLDLLVQSESRILYSFSLENTILAFSCINFVLPGMMLYKLSLSNFGKEKLNAFVTFSYKMLHLWLINIPYICVRLYFWTALGSNISVFMVKNFMSIFITICGSVSEGKDAIEFVMSTVSKKRRVYDSNQDITHRTLSGSIHLEKFDEINLSEFQGVEEVNLTLKN